MSNSKKFTLAGFVKKLNFLRGPNVLFCALRLPLTRTDCICKFIVKAFRSTTAGGRGETTCLYLNKEQNVVNSE